MKLLDCLLWRLPVPLLTPLLGPGPAHGAARSAPGAPAAPDGPTVAQDMPMPTGEDPPSGCGWFDSSHDLHRGLVVQEHLSADSLAQQMPLDAWLEWHLSGWHPPRLT